MVRDNPVALGATEAMQACELLFAVVLGVALLGERVPQGWALVGGVCVILGVVAFALVVAAGESRSRRRTQALRTDRGG